MRIARGWAAAVLLVACGCGGSSNPGPVSVGLLARVNQVGIPGAQGAGIAAFALGRSAADASIDLFLVPTNGFPGCAVVGGPGFSQSSATYSWAGFPNAHSIAVADFAEDGFDNDAVVTSLTAGSGETWIMGGLQQNDPFSIPDPWHEVSTELTTRLIVGDWDRDDDMDLALLEPLDTQVRLLFGDGAGNFVAPTRVPATHDVGLAPTTLLAADFNDDQTLDLAIAQGFAGTVRVLLGGADGAFTAAPDAVGVTGVQYMTAADFNGDDQLDLALSSQSQDAVVILRGQGNGTFLAPVPVALPADCAPTGIAAADLDDDGDIDLVVGLNDQADIAVLLNDGNGGMVLPASFRYAVTGGGLPRQVEVGDLDGDDDMDVFVLIDTRVVVFRQN